MNNEYSALRDEIILYMKKISLYSQIMFTAVFGLFSLLYGKDPIFIVFIYIIIISIQRDTVCCTRCIIKTGMYIFVFIEGKNHQFSWENALLFNDIKSNNKIKSNECIYYFLSIVTFVYSIVGISLFKGETIIEGIISNIFKKEYSVYCECAFFSLLFLIVILIIYISSIDYLREKEKYIRIWDDAKIHIDERSWYKYWLYEKNIKS